VSDDFTGTEHELVPGVLRGYRAWRWYEGRLIACNWGEAWGPGRNEARCLRYKACGVPECAVCRSKNHGPIPASSCACGFYAKHKPGDYDPRGSVLGVIKAYGKVVLGTLGFRAQYAEIEAISFVPHLLVYGIEGTTSDYYQVPHFTDPRDMYEQFPPIPVDELLPESVSSVETDLTAYSAIPPSGWAGGLLTTPEMWKLIQTYFPNGQAPL